MEPKKHIHLGADHAGFALKEAVKKALEHNYKITDHGAHEYNRDDDYPDYAQAVGTAISGRQAFGILFCGTAEGICIAANKIRGVRAVVATNTRIAKIARRHNNANILCLPGGEMRTKVSSIGMSKKDALTVIRAFLSTPFSDAPRHKRRIRKIKKLEQTR